MLSSLFWIILISISVSCSSGNLTDLDNPKNEILRHFNMVINALCNNGSCHLQINSMKDKNNTAVNDFKDELLKALVNRKYTRVINVYNSFSPQITYLVTIVDEIDNVIINYQLNISICITLKTYLIPFLEFQFKYHQKNIAAFKRAEEI